MDHPRKPSQSRGRPGGRAPRSDSSGRYGPSRPSKAPRPPAVDEPRERVLQALARQAGRFPDLDLFALDTSGLDHRDAAFAHALYDAVMRRWLTIEHLIRGCLNRPEDRVEPRSMAALLSGAAQMLFLDKAPAYAAVNQSVEWVKTRAGPGPSRLVNAVLRRIAELVGEGERQFRETYSDRTDELPLADGRALGLMHSALPDDPVRRLAAATSNPIELLRSWAKNSSLREARRLALHGLCNPPTILNVAHATSELPDGLTPHSAPGHQVFSGSREQLVSLLDQRRDIWVQDPASSLAVQMASDLKPGVIIDVCAGMGTKTRQLAAAFPEASIVATDVDLPRLATLKKSVASDRVTVIGFESLSEWYGKADLVFLDVPCSNTGVLARRVEARYRFDRARQESLTAMQRQILADSMRLLRRQGGSGKVLYSTCSLDPEENRDQSAWVSRWHGLRVERESERTPEGLPGDPPERYSDGSYASLLG